MCDMSERSYTLRTSSDSKVSQHSVKNLEVASHLDSSEVLREHQSMMNRAAGTTWWSRLLEKPTRATVPWICVDHYHPRGSYPLAMASSPCPACHVPSLLTCNITLGRLGHRHQADRRSHSLA